MTTQYTPTLKLALPVTGELSGTWGDVVNDNITSMIEQAIAGLATINTWTANAHTLTTANGTTSESRCAMLVAATGSGGTAITGAGEIVCPAAAKLYVLQNNTSYAVTLKTASGTGVAVAAGDTAFLFCDGTNVNSCVTTIVNGHITGNLTVDGNATINGNTTLGNATSDTVTVTARVASNVLPSADNTYDLGSTGNSWKDLWIDGTATMALVAISGGTINGVSIGATTPATFLAVDNLSLDGNTIASTNTNGNIAIAPNGTGDVQLDADTVRVGDAGAAVTVTSNGAGALTVTTGGAADLTLSTNSGATTGTITIANGVNGNITLTPDGTGDVILSADRVQIGDANTDATLTTNGTGNLNLTTNNGTNSGTIQIAQGANGNITLTPNGTGSVSVPKLVWSNGTATRVPYLTTGGQFTDSANLTFNGTDLTVSGAVNAGTINATTLDLTNLEVTNIKAKDGTAAMTIADSTGAVTVSSNFSTQGNTTLGNAAADNVTVTGTVTSNLLFTDDTYDIGASGATRPRREFLSQSLYIGGLTVPWSTTTRKVLQFGASGTSSYFSVSQQVTNNCFGSLAWGAYGTSTNEEWKYYTSADPANLFQMASGAYNWYRAGTGTADSVVSWTTSASLNSSGNFGLGGAPVGTYSNRRSLEILGNTVSNLSLGAAIGEITYNLYLNSGGSTLYQTDGPAALQNFNNNVSSGFAWLLAPTSTAGSAVSSLAQHMSLQRSASASILGIGPNTPTTSWEQTRAIAVGISASFFGDGETYNWPAGIVTNGYRTASNVWKYSASTASAIPSWKFEQGNGVNGWAWDYSVTGALNSTITYTRYMYLNNSGNLGMQVSSPSYQLDMGGGTTVSDRVQLRRGSDDSSQNLLLGWSSISSTRSSVSLSSAQTSLSFNQVGSDGTRTNLYINTNGTIGVGATNTYSWDITRHRAIAFGNGSSGNYLTLSQQFTASCPGNLMWNAYGSGDDAYSYMNTGDPASRISFAGNQIRMYGAATGTANAIISWAQMIGLQKDYSVALQGATNYSGTGITFPATQSASSDANTLDDYEEGTWTPTDASGAGLSLVVTGAFYTKVGNLVTCWFELAYPSTGNTSVAVIGGLPFASKNNSSYRWSCGSGYNNKSVTDLTLYGSYNSSQFNFYLSNGNGIANSSLSSGLLACTFSYQTN